MTFFLDRKQNELYSEIRVDLKSVWTKRPFDSFCLDVKLNANLLIATTVTNYFVS